MLVNLELGIVDANNGIWVLWPSRSLLKARGEIFLEISHMCSKIVNVNAIRYPPLPVYQVARLAGWLNRLMYREFHFFLTFGKSVKCTTCPSEVL